MSWGGALITPQQEAFAQLVAAGKSQSEAYRTAYPKAQNWKDATVWKRASEMMQRGEVLGRVEQVKAELADRGLWTREQSVRVLTEIAANGERESDKIKAVCELNKMHGFLAPDKHEHSGAAPIQFTFVKSSRE